MCEGVATQEAAAMEERSPASRPPFKKHGCSQSKSIHSLLFLTTIAIILFLIYKLQSHNIDGKDTSPFHLSRKWQEGKKVFHCPAEQCDANNCSLSSIENDTWVNVENQLRLIVCDGRVRRDRVCTVWMHKEYDSTVFPLWCSKPRSCQEKPAYRGTSDWRELCEGANQQVSKAQPNTAPVEHLYDTIKPQPLISVKPTPLPDQGTWRPGTITFKCPREECVDGSCTVYILQLKRPFAGYWSALSTKHVRTQCKTKDTCSVKLSAEYDDTWEIPYWCRQPTNCVTEPASYTRIDWRYACEIGLELKKLPTRTPPQEHGNVALTIMTEFAGESNVSNCWICQHMPISSRSPMLIPVPFTEADWSVMGWPDIARQFMQVLRFTM
ncbi:uncharacterized protein LOC130199985 isoform X3 [Pseudoliparis swirei]|uniref:uncharacterized protein LOC130199985 isoform X3 n=1 Tax=Pseudoliparis swirei TaxID=2059687 RepID=UPI0024BDC55E|nr:uncharacterized protein LOC130199985 isoform X3 [Pseudoliparis swirei]